MNTTRIGSLVLVLGLGLAMPSLCMAEATGQRAHYKRQARILLQAGKKLSQKGMQALDARQHLQALDLISRASRYLVLAHQEKHGVVSDYQPGQNPAADRQVELIRQANALDRAYLDFRGRSKQLGNDNQQIYKGEQARLKVLADKLGQELGELDAITDQIKNDVVARAIHAEVRLQVGAQRLRAVRDRVRITKGALEAAPGDKALTENLAKLTAEAEKLRKGIREASAQLKREQPKVVEGALAELADEMVRLEALQKNRRKVAEQREKDGDKAEALHHKAVEAKYAVEQYEKRLQRLDAHWDRAAEFGARSVADLLQREFSEQQRVARSWYEKAEGFWADALKEGLTKDKKIANVDPKDLRAEGAPEFDAIGFDMDGVEQAEAAGQHGQDGADPRTAGADNKSDKHSDTGQGQDKSQETRSAAELNKVNAKTVKAFIEETKDITPQQQGDLWASLAPIFESKTHAPSVVVEGDNVEIGFSESAIKPLAAPVAQREFYAAVAEGAKESLDQWIDKASGEAWDGDTSKRVRNRLRLALERANPDQLSSFKGLTSALALASGVRSHMDGAELVTGIALARNGSDGVAYITRGDKSATAPLVVNVSGRWATARGMTNAILSQDVLTSDGKTRSVLSELDGTALHMGDKAAEVVPIPQPEAPAENN